MQVQGFSRLRPVGQGGLGDVYVAIRDSTGSPVAIKMLRDWEDSSLSWHRAERELKALVGLQGHANVVHVQEVVEYQGVPLLVMEYAPGGSVADAVARGGRLALPDAVLIGEQTARALAASHALGIIHLDIKPQNLLIGSFGQVKVCDFGIAALTQDEQFRQHTSAHSLRYSSPEQLNEDDNLDSRSDIYSLGATLAYVVNGRPLPVVATDEQQVAKPFVLERDTRYDAAVQDRFEDIVNACLRRDPAQRPTASDLEDEFSNISTMLGDQRSRRLDVVVVPDDIDGDAGLPGPTGQPTAVLYDAPIVAPTPTTPESSPASTPESVGFSSAWQSAPTSDERGWGSTSQTAAGNTRSLRQPPPPTRLANQDAATPGSGTIDHPGFVADTGRSYEAAGAASAGAASAGAVSASVSRSIDESSDGGARANDTAVIAGLTVAAGAIILGGISYFLLR